MLYIARFGRTVVSFRNLEILPESWVIFRGAVAAWKSHGELVEDPNPAPAQLQGRNMAHQPDATVADDVSAQFIAAELNQPAWRGGLKNSLAVDPSSTLGSDPNAQSQAAYQAQRSP
jgi:hypothetical protein